MSDEVQRSLGRIEGTLAEIQRNMADAARRLETHMADDNRRLDEHDDEIGKVRRRQSWTSGASAVLGIIFGSAAEHFFNK